MLGGALIVAICLLLLGWTSEVVGLFVHDAEKVRFSTRMEKSRLTRWLETRCDDCGCGFGDLWG